MINSESNHFLTVMGLDSSLIQIWTDSELNCFLTMIEFTFSLQPSSLESKVCWFRFHPRSHCNRPRYWQCIRIKTLKQTVEIFWSWFVACRSETLTCLWSSCSLRLRRASSGEASVSWTLSIDRWKLFTSLSSLLRSCNGQAESCSHEQITFLLRCLSDSGSGKIR